VVWVDVAGLGDATVIEAIGNLFGLHRLALEDVVNVHQRAKVEPYDTNLFFVARMPDARTENPSEQISFFLGDRWVITFQERAGDDFGSVRARLRRGGRLRGMGSDYLLYALIDSCVDAWFPVIETFGERLEHLEDGILERSRRDTIDQIYGIRRELLELRRSVWPLRDALGALYRDPTVLISTDTRVYLRDCYDHAVQIIDLVENNREIAANLTDLYLSAASNRMNEVMKILTIISTIFLPLSFIAGVYGMNFDTGKPLNMPELKWWFGYPFALGLMAATALGLLVFFRRKGWMTSRPR
jgi:magnesium transporter